MNNVAVAVDVVEDLGQTGDVDGVVVEEHAKVTKRPAPPKVGLWRSRLVVVAIALVQDGVDHRTPGPVSFLHELLVAVVVAGDDGLIEQELPDLGDLHQYLAVMFRFRIPLMLSSNSPTVSLLRS